MARRHDDNRPSDILAIPGGWQLETSSSGGYMIKPHLSNVICLTSSVVFVGQARMVGTGGGGAGGGGGGGYADEGPDGGVGGGDMYAAVLDEDDQVRTFNPKPLTQSHQHVTCVLALCVPFLVQNEEDTIETTARFGGDWSWAGRRQFLLVLKSILVVYRLFLVQN